MAKKVVTFGEIMLRLAPEGYYRFVQATSYGATYGGGEANVAVSLANYGMDASFVTKLPAHEIGQAGVNALRQYGVDTSDIVRGGDRVGIYFLEKGASQRPSKVVYDRAGSSIATATTADFDWDKIFDGAGGDEQQFCYDHSEFSDIVWNDHNDDGAQRKTDHARGGIFSHYLFVHAVQWKMQQNILSQTAAGAWQYQRFCAGDDGRTEGGESFQP